MTKVAVSVIVPVKNEELNIGPCLDSVGWAAEVFVVDSASTDRTCEIATARGARVVQFRYDEAWPKKKNWALETLPLGYEWVLLLDADERVPPELAAEIAQVVSDPGGYDGFYVNRRLIFLGRWIRHCGWYPSWNLRLFKHERGRYERLSMAQPPGTGDVEVHEHVILDGKAGYLEHDLIHEDFKDVSHFIERHNRYSTWDAAVYRTFRAGDEGVATIAAVWFGGPLERKRKIKRLWARLPFRPLVRFLLMYVVGRGFLDGRPGLIFCRLMSFHEAIIDAKLYELDLRARRGP